jgi:Peptidase C13 family
MHRIATIFIFCWGLAVGATAQVAISFCPALDAKDSAMVYLGNEFKPASARQCGRCNTSCELAWTDPVGGYALGYYVYKDKNIDRWRFYGIAEDYENLLRAPLEAQIELQKHKLQDKKMGVKTLVVPVNSYLYRIQDEVQTILDASRHQFQAVRQYDSPWGDLAQIFSSFTVREKFAQLSVPFKGVDRAAACMNIFEGLADSLFWGYDVRRSGDTLLRCSINLEYPSFEIAIDGRASTIDWAFYGPAQSEGPQMVFRYDQCRRGIAGIDTLVSQKLTNGNDGYVVELTDESEIKQFTCGKDPIDIIPGESHIAVIEAQKSLNLKTVELVATDIHGNVSTKKVMLLQHETDPPKFTLLNPKNNIYLAPGDEVVLDKFNHRFVLNGMVKDDSPIRWLKINGSVVPLEDGNRFTHLVLPSDNHQDMKVDLVDANGNRLVKKFRLEFKESGADRTLKPGFDEEFLTRDEKHLQRNGKNGLSLQIKDDKFYMERIPQLDSAQSGGNAEISQAAASNPKLAIVPFGFEPMNFNLDFELKFTYAQLVDNSKFIITFGMNDTEDSYYFIFGERDNIFLGQMENGKPQCYGEGCSQNAFNNIYTDYEYLARERVSPSFFGQGTKVQYTLTIKRYNQFYIGTLDDPQDWLFIEISNNVDAPIKFKWKLHNGDTKITGTKCGFGLQEKANIAVSKVRFIKGDKEELPAFFDDKETERYCLKTCFAGDTTKGERFFDCLADDYHALIVANGDFGGRVPTLDSTLSRGRQLRDQLVNNYQFKGENVTLLENANEADFLSYLETKLPTHLTTKDRLVIYLISHGTEDKAIEFKDKALRSAYIWTTLAAKKADGSSLYKCKQVLVVLDACYSGEMVPNKQPEYNPNRSVCDAAADRSRLVMTSATNKTTKDSELTKEIIRALNAHPARFITVDKLFDIIEPEVSKTMQGSTKPSMSVFEPSSHGDNGSFLFVKRKFYH